MDQYLAKSYLGILKVGFTSAMVVQDPFEGGRNVSLLVSRQRLASMVATFTTAGRLLDSVLLSDQIQPNMGLAFVSLFQPGFPSFSDRCLPTPSPHFQRVVIQPAGSEKSGRHKHFIK